MTRQTFVSAVDHVIRERKTKKLLGNASGAEPHPLDDSGRLQEFDAGVQACLALAGWAPFHHGRGALDVDCQRAIPEPWRFYHLDRLACLTLLHKIDELLSPEDRRGKVPALLASAGALVIATWLPDVEQPILETDDPDSAAEKSKTNRKLEMRNEEHLAATACAVHNLILAAEARGLDSYWSSGGLLRDDRVRRYLDLSIHERIIGTVFLAPCHTNFANITVAPGGQRRLRTAPAHWCRRVNLLE